MVVKMKNLTAEYIEREYTIKQLQAYNSEIRSKYNDMKFKYNLIVKNQETIIEKEVEIRTKKTNC